MTGAHQALPSILEPTFTPDGRRVHRFSQSLLKTADLCLDRARLDLSRLIPRTETDATAVGTACHEAIELCLTEVIADQGPMALSDMIAVACDEFTELSQYEGFEWVKVKTATTAHARIARCLTTFYQRVLPSLSPLAVEYAWGPLVIHEDDKRVIEMTGTIDYIDRLVGPADWKTTSQTWEPWQHARWDPQPSAYVWALWLLGEITAYGPWPFMFHVFNVDGGYQGIEVQRDVGDFDWLARKCINLAELIEAELPRWPVNDSHALCSPKYCPVFADCKGAHVHDGWPKYAA